MRWGSWRRIETVSPEMWSACCVLLRMRSFGHCSVPPSQRQVNHCFVPQLLTKTGNADRIMKGGISKLQEWLYSKHCVKLTVIHCKIRFVLTICQRKTFIEFEFSLHPFSGALPVLYIVIYLIYRALQRGDGKIDLQNQSCISGNLADGTIRSSRQTPASSPGTAGPIQIMSYNSKSSSMGGSRVRIQPIILQHENPIVKKSQLN